MSAVDTDQPAPPTLPPPPTQPPPPASSSPQRPSAEPVPLYLAWLMPCLVVGVAFDLAIRRQLPSLIWTVFLLAVVAVLVFTRGIDNAPLLSRTGRMTALAALPFAFLLTLRTDQRLAVACLAIVVALLLVAVVQDRRWFDVWPISPLRYALCGLQVAGRLPGTMHAAWSSPSGPLVAAERQGERQAQRATEVGQAQTQVARDVLLGVLLAAPLLVILTALLVKADVVFAETIAAIPVKSGATLTHVLVAGVAALVCLWQLSTASSFSGPNSNHDPRTPSTAGPLTKTVLVTILGLVNLLLTFFAISQILARTGFAEETLAESGMNYSDYARQGFFQLLWVAGLLLVGLASVRILASIAVVQSRPVVALSLATIVLTEVVVASALFRFSLYIDDSGLTPLRFYSSVATGWIGIALVIVGIRIIGVANDRGWLLPVMVGLAAATVLIVGVLNPEQVIVDHNLERSETVLLTSLDKLTADGWNEIMTNLDQLPPRTASLVLEDFCTSEHRFAKDGGWLSYNGSLGRANERWVQTCDGKTR